MTPHEGYIPSDRSPSGSCLRPLRLRRVSRGWLMKKNCACTASFCKLGSLKTTSTTATGASKNAIGLMSQTTLPVYHAFLYISLQSLHNYDVKWPNFKLTWERERQGDKFYHLCSADYGGCYRPRRWHPLPEIGIILHIIRKHEAKLHFKHAYLDQC